MSAPGPDPFECVAMNTQEADSACSAAESTSGGLDYLLLNAGRFATELATNSSDVDVVCARTLVGRH